MRPSEHGTIPRLALDSARRFAGRSALEEDGQSWTFEALAAEGCPELPDRTALFDDVYAALETSPGRHQVLEPRAFAQQ